ncbi:hypothetical protein THAOC_05772, partial [Thalassiosira oceanica]
RRRGGEEGGVRLAAREEAQGRRRPRAGRPGVQRERGGGQRGGPRVRPVGRAAGPARLEGAPPRHRGDHHEHIVRQGHSLPVRAAQPGGVPALGLHVRGRPGGPRRGPGRGPRGSSRGPPLGGRLEGKNRRGRGRRPSPDRRRGPRPHGPRRQGHVSQVLPGEDVEGRVRHRRARGAPLPRLRPDARLVQVERRTGLHLLERERGGAEAPVRAHGGGRPDGQARRLLRHDVGVEEGVGELRDHRGEARGGARRGRLRDGPGGRGRRGEGGRDEGRPGGEAGERPAERGDEEGLSRGQVAAAAVRMMGSREGKGRRGRSWTRFSV